MWAGITTRPDIFFAAQHLSQFSSNPSPEHLTALKRVYRYLKGTINLGIMYTATNTAYLTLFTDADWANNLDDRRSISGYVSTISGGAITWSSKKQPTMALSSMEAEYMALANAAHKNLWLRSLFSEINLPPNGPTPIRVDNRCQIQMCFLILFLR